MEHILLDGDEKRLALFFFYINASESVLSDFFVIHC